MKIETGKEGLSVQADEKKESPERENQQNGGFKT